MARAPTSGSDTDGWPRDEERAKRSWRSNTILTTIWHIAQTGELYDDPGPDFYTRLRPERARQHAIRELTNMGYRVTLEPTG